MYKGKSILVVVPARGGSKGVKLKNIRLLNGLPLVGIVGNVIKELDYIDMALCSTDHKQIAQVAREYGLKVPFFRTEKLSGDRIGDFDVLNEALFKIEEIEKKEYDIVVMLQPTSPSRTSKNITDTIDKLIEGNYDSVWTVSETDTKGHPLKQFTINQSDMLEYYDAKGESIIARQQLTPVYHRNGVAYAITRDCLVKQKTIYGEKSSALIIEGYMANIDTELDFKLAEFFLNDKRT